jgi:hypothetical protein
LAFCNATSESAALESLFRCDAEISIRALSKVAASPRRDDTGFNLVTKD